MSKRKVATVLTNEISVYKLPHENLSYVVVLQKYFELRRKRNTRYSLRKFAAELGLTPMHLSYVLRGQRGLSRQKAERVASVLKLSFAERKTFLQIVSALSGRAFRERNLAQLGLRHSFMTAKPTASDRPPGGSGLALRR